MERRDLLVLSALFAARHAIGAGSPSTKINSRAAVVIGVDRAGNLPILSAARKGAQDMTHWLKSEGFDVTLFTDDAHPVTASQIKVAISSLVQRGTLDQLVVYFSGHGFINSYSEYWVLSGAPQDADEAINLLESVALARESGIANIVFISDACRSRADSLGCERVRGSVVFPNIRGNGKIDPDVDLFLATRVGDAALEIPVKDSAHRYEGIFTATFLSAFVAPYPDMVKDVNGESVIPNNRLRSYLKNEVQRRAEQHSIKLSQVPHLQVTSADNFFLGHLRSASATPPQPSPDKIQSPETNEVAQPKLVNLAVGEILQARAPRHFETQCGISVTGSRVRATFSSANVRTVVLENGVRDFSLIKVYINDHSGATICVQFEDGSGAVIAVLNGYISNIHVSGGGVAHVSYVPSENSPRWNGHQWQTQINTLQAIVAAKTRYGEFLIDTGKNRQKSAMELADQIRAMKSIDPSLGIYAAYAYSNAGLSSEAKSVFEYMRSDLRLDIFDVAMLADELRERSSPSIPVFPFCPMLSQGWNLLRVKGPGHSDLLDSLRDLLAPALWTTFRPQGIEIVVRALESNRFT